MRLGTATEKDVSGTVQEIREFSEKHGADKVAIFRSELPYDSTVDTQELERLRTFFKEIQSEYLYRPYDSLDEFRSLVDLQLGQVMNELLASVSTASNSQNESSLTPEAATLLCEASLDSEGDVMMLSLRGGLQINSNGLQFVDPDESRSVAKWRSAVEQLVNEGFLTKLGYKGQSFQITGPGFERADELWNLRFLEFILDEANGSYVELDRAVEHFACLTGSDRPSLIRRKQQLRPVAERAFSKLAEEDYIEPVPTDSGITAARCSSKGERYLRSNSSIRFAQITRHEDL